MTTKRFTVGEILTVMHGRMLCGVDGIYRLCNHMTGESLMTHQLPRAARESEASLKAQFPDLAGIDVNIPPITSEADVIAYLASLEPTYGTHRDVESLAVDEHTHIDPIQELKMLRPDMPIVVVEVSDGE